ncbi:MAG: hypothetical protein AABY22_07935, partial [Nanoarchaeota archaeon]
MIAPGFGEALRLGRTVSPWGRTGLSSYGVGATSFNQPTFGGATEVLRQLTPASAGVGNAQQGLGSFTPEQTKRLTEIRQLYNQRNDLATKFHALEQAVASEKLRAAQAGQPVDPEHVRIVEQQLALIRGQLGEVAGDAAAAMSEFERGFGDDGRLAGIARALGDVAANVSTAAAYVAQGFGQAVVEAAKAAGESAMQITGAASSGVKWAVIGVVTIAALVLLFKV